MFLTSSIRSTEFAVITIKGNPNLNVYLLNDDSNKYEFVFSIRQNSIEFLRPVFLYMLCNPVLMTDSKSLWTCLLSHNNNNSRVQNLVHEILAWCNVRFLKNYNVFKKYKQLNLCRFPTVQIACMQAFC